ncbi:MAG: hypothetical protein IIW23_00225 [Clostridia bacterium]|nr:hypothetical protein [Clostridia bacterium]
MRSESILPPSPKDSNISMGSNPPFGARQPSATLGGGGDAGECPLHFGKGGGSGAYLLFCCGIKSPF